VPIGITAQTAAGSTSTAAFRSLADLLRDRGALAAGAALLLLAAAVALHPDRATILRGGAMPTPGPMRA
jgi:hypothetical protein